MNATFDRAAVDDLMIFHDAVPDLRPRGKRLVGHCPLHSEKTASFSVSVEKKLFYCFGCGAGGDALTLTMLLHKVNFIEAAKRLNAWRNIRPEERARLWRERQKAAEARRQREHYEQSERELFLELRSTVLLLEAITRHSVKLLEIGVDDSTAESLRESIAICSRLTRQYSAGFSLLGFGAAAAREDYVLRPERRHAWHEKILTRGFVRDDRSRATEVLL
jgi:hypothetical protein